MERTIHRSIRWDRIIGCILLTILMVFVAWVCVSYLNVVLHNQEEHPVYFEWNAFTCLYDNFGNLRHSVL